MLQKLESDLISAMKSKDVVRVGTIRLLISEFKNAQIDLRAKGEELTTDICLKILNREAKKRKESIDLFAKSGRTDLVDSETAELEIIEEYLPKQMSEDELEIIVKGIVSELSDKNFGNAMKAVMEKVKGQADGKIISDLVKKHI